MTFLGAGSSIWTALVAGSNHSSESLPGQPVCARTSSRVPSESMIRLLLP